MPNLIQLEAVYTFIDKSRVIVSLVNVYLYSLKLNTKHVLPYRKNLLKPNAVSL